MLSKNKNGWLDVRDVISQRDFHGNAATLACSREVPRSTEILSSRGAEEQRRARVVQGGAE